MRVSRSLTALVLFIGSVVIVVLPGEVAGADVSVAAISAGNSHTCAVTSGGGVQCWGWNDQGQLGDGTTVDRLAPVDVSGLGSGVATVAAGYDHTCALTTGGAVKCWGNADLGDGTTSASHVPVDVVGLGSGVVAIASGVLDTCALTTAGAVKCWGDNSVGEIGDGTTTTALVPVSVAGLGSGVTAISAGGGYACAVTAGGGVKCWGYNAYGKLGDGTLTNRLTPVDVSGLHSDVAAVSAGGDQACALTTGGGVKCWGRNNFGQLGDGTSTDRRTPVAVSGLGSGVAAVSSGQGTDTCALTVDGALKCWGWNGQGQLGNATTDDAHAPIDVAGLGSGVVGVSVGDAYTCALTGDSAMYCWGFNGNGQLGTGAGTHQLAPVGVSGLASGVTAIAAGSHHTCAIVDGGALKCWGDNSVGQLGDGATIEADTPVDVSGLGSGVAAVAAGYDHTCALTTGGAVRCWGDNAYGQLGDGTTIERHTPVGVTGLASGVTAIAAGVYDTCALTAAGTVKCWGYNADGELGDGTNTPRDSPVSVSGLGSDIVGVSTGNDTCVLTSAGAVKCSGLGIGIGDGTTNGSNVPVDVTGLSSGVTAISGGGSHTCALTTAGGLKCWGDNGSGELGDGTTNFGLIPVDVTGFGSGAAAVEASASDTCALTTGGGVQCWGYNGDGELGDGTTFNFQTPVDVATLGSGVVSITAKGDHACAVTSSGSAECWGNDATGQLGNGAAGRSLVPVGVAGLGLAGALPADAPVAVAVAPENGAASASWTPPSNDGGAPIYGYAVTVTDATGGAPTGVTGSTVRTTSTVGTTSSGSMVRTSATLTTFRFSGLSNGIQYRFDVAPLNRAGIGASVLSSIVRPGPPVVATPKPTGYWMVGATGTVYAFGHVSNHGSAGTSAVTHIEPTPTGRGYWVANASGAVFPFGDAKRLPDADRLAPGEIVTGISSTPTGNGYWLFTNLGRVMSRGDARFLGDLHATTLNGPIVGSVATPTGNGYYMVGSDGGVFAFGDARFRGSMAAVHLNKSVNGLVPTVANNGYWLVASDGGIFSFNAPFRGSMGSIHLNKPAIGMVRYGNGYLMVASDGGIFDFSNLPFSGSLGAHPPQQPIVSVAASN